VRGVLVEVGRAGVVRRRSGAIGWAVYEDPAAPDVMLEVFMVDSWIEHLRQHERGTRSGRTARQACIALLQSLDGDAK
jgi:hypothetical protein